MSHVPFCSKSIYERYEFLDVLGEGGMGTVFKARDVLLDREVAIKTISSDVISESQRQLLSQEATIQAKLNHPNVVTLYDIIVDEAAIGLVLEYIEGLTIKEICALRPISLKKKLNWLKDIISGLSHAHSYRIVHCDLKPDNILITKHGTAKVSDFGIARLIKANESEIDQEPSMATRLYSSPEQLWGEKPDAQSDLFSFGILVHIVLSAEHPFGDLTEPKVIEKNISERAIIRIDTALPQTLHEPLSRLLKQKRSQRAVSLVEIENAIDYELAATTNHHYENTAPNIAQQNANKGLSNLLLSIFVVAVFAGLIVFLGAPWTNTVQKEYVAITPLQIDDQIDVAQQWRFNAAINRTLNEFVRSNDSLSLAANEFSATARGVEDLAAISGADTVLAIQSNCVAQQCEIILQRFNSQKREVIREARFQILTQSIDLVRLETLQAAYSLWDQKPSIDLIAAITPKAFNDYLAIYKSSKGGTAAAPTHLTSIRELLVNSPTFIPLYKLYALSAQHVWEQTGDKAHLRSITELVDHAPIALAESSELESIQIQALISGGQLDKAERRLVAFRKIAQDKIQANDLGSHISFERGDYEKTLQLDKQNVGLQPSVWRWHNLAVSQYSSGSLVHALESIEEALKLVPDHLYALDLKAVLMMVSGELDGAFEIYSKMNPEQMDVDALSNLAYLELVQGNIKTSIEVISQAIDRNDTVAAYFLNRADAYRLHNNTKLALRDYEKAVALASNNDGPDALSVQAQALAHLGKIGQSLKVAEDAKRHYPESANVIYGAAIVQTIAGNADMALIEISRLLEMGQPQAWLDGPWFRPLCTEPRFVEMIKPTKTCIRN